MSHLKERHEKTCLNCQATLYGRYCHVCGQENLEPKETVWHLVTHFFNDITHFDGKFFSTGKYLISKPGFLSGEYMAGRRASYLNPIRMYVFTSAIFFLLMFSMTKPSSMVHTNGNGGDKDSTGTTDIWTSGGSRHPQSLGDMEKRLVVLDSSRKVESDADDRADLNRSYVKTQYEIWEIKKLYGDTTTRKFTSLERKDLLKEALKDTLYTASISAKLKDSIERLNKQPKKNMTFWDMGSLVYSNVGEYDSAERSLPDSLRDGWLKRSLMHKVILANEEAHADGRKYSEHLIENFLHSVPKILFWSLPFFALILNVLYFRRKKTYYYVDHGIFTIHLYCAVFIIALAGMLLYELSSALNIVWVGALVGLINTVLFFWANIYLYKAMRRFYKQGRGKTVIKYILLWLSAFTINMILMMIFLAISAVSV